MEITQFILPIITGLATGMLTYLMASGMSLIVCGMGTINFAQGSYYLLGAMVCYNLSKFLPFGIAMLGGFLVPFLLGLIIEYALRPVAGKDMIYSMLVTMSVMYIMGDIMQMIWGTKVRATAVPSGLDQLLRFGKVVIPSYYAFIILISAIIAIIFWIMFYKTKLGYYFRAIISDSSMVSNLGINVQFMYTLMFMIGVGMAGIAGALKSPLSGLQVGQSMTLFGTVMPVLIIGGMNNMKGALPAALTLGVLQAIAAIFMPTYYNLIPSVAMVICMFFKPEGLFTRKET